MLLVFAPKITNRLKYTFTLVLKNLLGLDFQFTTSAEEFASYQGPRMIYGKQAQVGELCFGACDLLFQRGITISDVPIFAKDGLFGLFPVYCKDAVLPFDPFASVFYMVSRYEEYLPYRKDVFGRFTAHESLAYKKGFLNKAVVNRWALQISDILKQHFNGLKFQFPAYQFVPTIDVDSAWSHLNKGLLRTSGGYARDLLNGNFAEIKARTRVLAGMDRDPFDSFSALHALHERYGLEPLYFIVFGEYGQYDKNGPTQNPAYKHLIKSLADYARVGLHPAYASNSSTNRLKMEVDRLSDVLKREIHHSRQHFLKLELPITYRNLINFDIRHDYTMGFAAESGFRAGICSPFLFYDLDLDVQTNLMVHPFTVMDGTLKDYLKLPNDKVLQYVEPLINEVKAVGGTFVSLWHNETHGGLGRWVGWPELYRMLIEMAV